MRGRTTWWGGVVLIAGLLFGGNVVRAANAWASADYAGWAQRSVQIAGCTMEPMGGALGASTGWEFSADALGSLEVQVGALVDAPMHPTDCLWGTPQGAGLSLRYQGVGLRRQFLEWGPLRLTGTGAVWIGEAIVVFSPDFYAESGGRSYPIPGPARALGTMGYEVGLRGLVQFSDRWASVAGFGVGQWVPLGMIGYRIHVGFLGQL